jgi:molybdate transport system substrate-binding protein
MGRVPLTRLRVAAAGLAVAAVAPAAAGAENSLPISVLASSSLEPAFTRIEQAPEYSFADSDLLANSLRQRVPVDVYAGAGTRQPQALYRERVIAKPVTFATRRLVLIVPRANPGHVRTVNDLRRKSVSLMLTPSGLSYGAQARTLLSRLHLGGAARRARRGPANPAQLAAQIAAGKADAGIVVIPDTARVAAKLRRIALPAKSRPTGPIPDRGGQACPAPQGRRGVHPPCPVDSGAYRATQGRLRHGLTHRHAQRLTEPAVGVDPECARAWIRYGVSYTECR